MLDALFPPLANKFFMAVKGIVDDTTTNPSLWFLADVLSALIVDYAVMTVHANNGDAGNASPFRLELLVLKAIDTLRTLTPGSAPMKNRFKAITKTFTATMLRGVKTKKNAADIRADAEAARYPVGE